MGSAYIPTYTTEKVHVGNTSVSDPLLLLSVNGTVYANGYSVDVTGGNRNIFPTYDSATGNIYLTCTTVIYSNDTPSFTIYNVEVLVVG